MSAYPRVIECALMSSSMILLLGVPLRKILQKVF
jgi:hypothetical protein